MGLFTRKSKSEMALDYIVGAAGSRMVKSGVKVVAGTLAALVGLTAASAAISSAREQE